ncbi:alpha/beta hydrolase [uncultured Methylobacterium sp.]|uniref:alpha/beta hydrolase n=1 Tax=uncultured Methylobacterium sp. TaxID=157278 RepID=UPI0035CA677A
MNAKRMIRRFARAALVAAAAMGPAAAQETPPRPDPATFAGYFYIGGRYERVGDKTLMVGQMFVQSRRPVSVTQPWPLVLVHGISQTGVNFLGTPDGRPGWVQRFVEHGFAVYVVDQVGRGRSGTNPEVYGPYARYSARALEETYTAQEVYDLFPQARLHTQWPGGRGVQGNAAFDQFVASQVPYLASAQQTEELVDPALIALLEKIGPAVLVTHGQAGLFGWAVSDARPDLVKAHVAVEPNGPPFFDVRLRGGKDFYEKAGEGRARAYGITRVPLTYDPPVRSPEDLVVAQARAPTAEGRIRCWLQGDPVRRLPNLARVPALIVTAEASFRTPVDECTAAFLTQAGAKPDTLRLAEAGIHGNGHMMMLEKNSDQVADALIGWITARPR